MLALHHNESVALCSLQGVLYYVVCVYTRLQQCRDQVSFSKAQTSGFEIALLHENFPLCVCVLQLCLLPTPLFYTCKYAKEHPKNSHEDQPNNPDWDLPPRRCHTLSTCIILNLRYTYLLSWCLMEVSVQMPACQVVLFKFFNTYEYTTLYIWSFDRYRRSFTRLKHYFEFYDLRPSRKNL